MMTAAAVEGITTRIATNDVMTNYVAPQSFGVRRAPANVRATVASIADREHG